MDALAPLAAPVVLALLALLGWAASRGRRPPPGAPSTVGEVEALHGRQVEALRTEARVVVEDAARVDALPDAERNREAGRRLRR